jgi:hypothetical protein
MLAAGLSAQRLAASRLAASAHGLAAHGLAPSLATSNTTDLLLGNNLLAYIFLALGGALLVGNGLALVRPPDQPTKGDLRRAPVGRTVVMMIVGGLVAIWALASLLSV